MILIKNIDNEIIKVISFNLKRDSRFAKRNQWNSRKKLIANIVKKSDACIIGVQELMPSMRDDMQKILSGYSVFGMGRSVKLKAEHSDIIIKDDDTKVEYFKTFWLSKKPDNIGSRAFLSIFPRICTMCEVTLKKSGKKIRVFNTHFDHISTFARNIGVKVILGQISSFNKIEPLPTIVMGDMNAKPYSKSIKQIQGHLHEYDDIKLYNVFNLLEKKEPGKYKNTLHGFKGKEKKYPIDYIFVSDDFEVLDAVVDKYNKDGRYPSDHYPIIATLKLKGEKI